MAKQKQNKQQPKKPKARKMVLKGKGDYATVDLATLNDIDKRLAYFEKNKPSTAVGKMAQMAGHALGSMVGEGDLGGQAGSTLAKWFGYGDYNVHVNSLIPVANGQPPQTGLKFDKDGKRGTRIIDREYIGDVFSGSLVSGSSVFTNTSYFLNPGNSQMFPWLSTIANQFEQYRPNGIIFEFISTSSSYNGTNQALGTVIAATDYDPSDAAFTSKLEMENADYANSSKAANNLMHGIECDLTERGDQVLLVRSGDVGTESKKFYDLGIFQLATMGMSAANVNLGELWVSYDFTFYKKQLLQGQLGNTTLCMTVASSNPTTSNYFGTVSTRAGTLNCTLGSTTITFPSSIVTGRYILNYYLAGTAAVCPTISATTNCIVSDASSWSGVGFAGSFSSAAGTATYEGIIIKITGPSAVVTFSAGTLTSVAMNMILSQLPLNTQALIT